MSSLFSLSSTMQVFTSTLHFLCLLAVADQALLAVDRDYDFERQSPGDLIATWEHPVSSRFALGSTTGTWTRAERGTLEWQTTENSNSTTDLIGGVQVAFDSRHGEFDKSGTINAQATVISLCGGGQFHLIPSRARATIDPTIAITGRAGVGFQSGTIEGFPVYGSNQTGNGSLSPLRYEFGLGIDAGVTLKRRITVLAGIGTSWFLANQATYVSAGGGGSTVVVSAQYAGSEIYTHLGIGVRF